MSNSRPAAQNLAENTTYKQYIFVIITEKELLFFFKSDIQYKDDMKKSSNNIKYKENLLFATVTPWRPGWSRQPQTSSYPAAPGADRVH